MKLVSSDYIIKLKKKNPLILRLKKAYPVTERSRK